MAKDWHLQCESLDTIPWMTCTRLCLLLIVLVGWYFERFVPCPLHGAADIKLALLSMADNGHNNDDRQNLQLNYGALFFGVPLQGMDVNAFATMIEGLPSSYTATLLDKNLGWKLRDKQDSAFSKLFSGSEFFLTQFYETRKTPTVQWIS